MLHSKKLIRILVDLVGINLAYWVSYAASSVISSVISSSKEKSEIDLFNIHEDMGGQLLALWVIINLLWFATLTLANKLYGRFEYTTFPMELKSVKKNYLMHIIIFTVIAFVTLGLGKPVEGCTIWNLDARECTVWEALGIGRKLDRDYASMAFGFIVMYYGVLLIFLFLGRYLLKRFLPSIKGVSTLNYIIIGYCKALPEVRKTISDAHLNKVNYLGSFGKRIKPSKKDNKPKDSKLEENRYIKIGETSADVYDFLKNNDVNLILYASNIFEEGGARQLKNYSLVNFIDFKIIPLEVELLSGGVKMELHNGFPLISVKDENIARLRNRLLKRIFDIIFSSLVIVFILSWLYPILALLIKRQSPGPVLFNQKRVGYKNKHFICHKFRSMILNKESDTKQATKNDSRITKIGAFMRRTNLDEMPQFFNVFKGDMSVVGPRPHPIYLDEGLANEVEDYILRHYTKPGITGWAQVNGFRGPTETTESKEGRTEYDLHYLKKWSFFLDLQIIFLTVFGKKTQENAF